MASELANLDSQIQMQQECVEAKEAEMRTIRNQIDKVLLSVELSITSINMKYKCKCWGRSLTEDWWTNVTCPCFAAAYTANITFTVQLLCVFRWRTTCFVTSVLTLVWTTYECMSRST